MTARIIFEYDEEICKKLFEELEISTCLELKAAFKGLWAKIAPFVKDSGAKMRVEVKDERTNK